MIFPVFFKVGTRLLIDFLLDVEITFVQNGYVIG